MPMIFGEKPSARLESSRSSPSRNPSFSECMVRRVSEYVLGTLGDPVDTEALSKVFEKQHRLRPLVRAALLRFAERSRAERPTDLPEVQDPQVAVDPQRIRVSRSMRSLIDTNCVGCHENQDDALLGDTVSRSFAEKMLVQVSSGRMPMDLLGMPVQDRRRMVVELASALWSDPLERREAMDHHLQGLDFARVIDSFAVTPLLRARVGVSAPKQRLNFVGLLSASQVFPSPGYVSGVMFEALAACKERGIGNDPVALKGCLSQAAPPDLYTIDR
ncbi:MAG: hypothetical protein IPJ65_24340 [Archangiaceae bacterium]|nr:hypothetical protein [Archangiaceae bacterium]